MTTYDYFLEWLRGESAAAWAQFLVATITLAATFVAANMPIWAQAKADKARQTQLEGALLAITWRIGGFCQTIVDGIDDPALRAIMAHHETKTMMEADIALAELASFPKIELEDATVRFRLDMLQTTARRVRNNLGMIFEHERNDRSFSADWTDIAKSDNARLLEDLSAIAEAVGSAAGRRNPRNPVIHRVPSQT